MSDLKDLYESTVTLLLVRIKDGTATPGDLAVAIKLLKDSGYSADLVNNKDLKGIIKHFPFQSPSDDEIRRSG